MHWYVFGNLVLAALVVGAIVGLLLWAVLTQHHDHKCEDVRLTRPRISSWLASRRTPRADQLAEPITFRGPSTERSAATLEEYGS
jgi:hypothetical protein